MKRFIECLKHTKGEFHGKPFKLLPWQDKIITDVFGTVRDDDPTMRQYNTAYVEISKKQGKDYQFSRLWTSPDMYTGMLRKFRFVCTPDFSMYTDFPLALQINSHYRKHWLGAYWQKNGIAVVPTICWSDIRSFEWCFDGEPSHGAVAVSSVGTQLNQKAKSLFLLGFEQMMYRLQPQMVLFHGRIPAEITAITGSIGDENTPVIVPFAAYQERLRKIDMGVT